MEISFKCIFKFTSKILNNSPTASLYHVKVPMRRIYVSPFLHFISKGAHFSRLYFQGRNFSLI